MISLTDPKGGFTMSDQELRLEALRIAAQTQSPVMYEGSLLVRAEEIYNYIKTGKYNTASAG